MKCMFNEDYINIPWLDLYLTANILLVIFADKLNKSHNINDKYLPETDKSTYRVNNCRKLCLNSIIYILIIHIK